MTGHNNSQNFEATQSWINSRLVLLKGIAEKYLQEQIVNPHSGRETRPKDRNLTSVSSILSKEQPKLSPIEVRKLLKQLDNLLWSHKGEGTEPWEATESLFKHLDYRFYNQMRRQKRSNICGLYVIIDPQFTNNRNPLNIAEAALRGGAKLLQLREKAYPNADTLSLTKELQRLCQKQNALFIVNDYADLAATGAVDGLHIGQKDISITQARHILDPLQIIGQSNASYDEALASERMGADYIAIGSIYPTNSKAEARAAGLETLRKVKKVSSRPIVAIGGIRADNVHAVVQAGADAICVLSAIGLAPDPESATRALVQSIYDAKMESE